MKHCWLVILSFNFIGPHANAAVIAKKDFLQKFPLKEGHYDTLLNASTPSEFCEDEELDILLRQDDDNLVLTIGAKLVFAELQKTASISDGGKNCKVNTNNTLDTNSLRQVVTEKCGKKLTYSKTHTLKVNGDMIEYVYTTNGKSFQCKYKFLKEVVQP